jgi:hypothetical protein
LAVTTDVLTEDSGLIESVFLGDANPMISPASRGFPLAKEISRRLVVFHLSLGIDVRLFTRFCEIQIYG